MGVRQGIKIDKSGNTPLATVNAQGRLIMIGHFMYQGIHCLELIKK